GPAATPPAWSARRQRGPRPLRRCATRCGAGSSREAPCRLSKPSRRSRMTARSLYRAALRADPLASPCGLQAIFRANLGACKQEKIPLPLSPHLSPTDADDAQIVGAALTGSVELAHGTLIF